MLQGAAVIRDFEAIVSSWLQVPRSIALPYVCVSSGGFHSILLDQFCWVTLDIDPGCTASWSSGALNTLSYPQTI